ncbi:MAG: hypothetical protein ACRCZ0_07230 [Cetobacterium sp.]
MFIIVFTINMNFENLISENHQLTIENRNLSQNNRKLTQENIILQQLVSNKETIIQTLRNKILLLEHNRLSLK